MHPAGGQHTDAGGVTVELADLPAQPAGDHPAVELGLDEHPAVGQVQPASETQQG